MIEQLNDYDWTQAFETSDVRSLPGSSVATTPFGREDVLTVLSSSEGCRDESPWLMVGLLKDGRFFYLEAGCDYTGWDCQAYGSMTVSATLEELMSTAIPEQNILRMKSGS